MGKKTKPNKKTQQDCSMTAREQGITLKMWSQICGFYLCQNYYTTLQVLPPLPEFLMGIISSVLQVLKIVQDISPWVYEENFV